MPYTPTTIIAKDANSVSQHVKAQGAGTQADPYLPLHGDLGIGAIDDPSATNALGNWSVISILKLMISRVFDLNSGVGGPNDPSVTTPNSYASLISLSKSVWSHLILSLGSGGDSIAIGNPTLIGQWSVISILKAIHAAIVGFETTPYTTFNVANTLVMKGAPGYLHSISCTNHATSTRYLLLFDQTTVPVASTVPLRSYPVYPNSGMSQIDELQWGKSGLAFATGIAWALSSTPHSCTLAADANATIEARYR
jgi:hypothetical protein